MHLKTTDTNSLKPPIFSTVLLVLVLVTIFGIPAFPQQMHRLLFIILFTLIIISAALSMDRGRGIIIKFAVAVVVFEWIADILNLKVLLMSSRIVIFLFFIMIVICLITQIARRKKVTARVIMESISGYLLLGMVFSLVVAVVVAIHPEAFSFAAMYPKFGNLAYYQSDFIYYSFVTYTTLGYGEIVPQVPYAKSLAVLISVSGQIYLTVIIAMLVGKFLSHSQDVS